jgi:hypothetical protein
MKKALVIVALIASATVVSPAQTTQTTQIVPAPYFAMHFNHGTEHPLNQDLETLSYGAFRLWDTNTRWEQIAGCDPGPTCDPETDSRWHWSSIDTLLNDMNQIPLNDVLYTFGGVPDYANGCNSSQQTCVYNGVTFGPGQTYYCGNTSRFGCVPPSDLPLNGGGLGDTHNMFWQHFVTALAKHVLGITTTTACNGLGYLSCHAKIIYWDPMNEWDRNAQVRPTQTANETIYATEAQMQRMTRDLHDIVTGIDNSEKVTTPSMAGPSLPVLQGFLYCTGFPTNCNTNLLGTTPEQSISLVISHDYASVAESVLETYNDYKGALQQAEKNLPLWITEGSWGCDLTCQNSYLTDYDLQAAYVGRLYLLAWTAGFGRWYWYSADNLSNPPTSPPSGVGTLVGPNWNDNKFGPGLWWSGKAYNRVYGWMVGMTMTQPCAETGTIYTCELTALATLAKSLAVWDTDSTNYSCSGAQNPMTHGKCNTHGYTTPAGYNAYETLDPADGIKCLSGGMTVPIGAKPILLINSSTCPPQ